MYILGGLDDQLPLLLWSMVSNFPFSVSDPNLLTHKVYADVFFSYIYPWKSNEPLLWLFLSFFSSLIGPHFYTLFVFITFILSFLCSYFLFKRFKFPLFYSLIFTLSSYMWSHSTIHPDLAQVWVFPLFLNFLLQKLEKVRLKFLDSVHLTLLILCIALISNYYGFFVLLLFAVVVSVVTVQGFLKNRVINFTLLKLCITTIILSFLLITLALFPYIKANYLNTSSQNTEYLYQLTRPIGDFVTFSSRPWYFLIPPVKNPFLGNYALSFVDKIKSFNYFLTDDYFAGEHSGNYFGIIFTLSLIGIVFLVFRSKNFKDSVYRDKIILFFSTFILIYVLALPPFFTIAGIEVYMPSFLIFKFLPMLRVTSRLSIVCLLCLLMMCGYCVSYIYSLRPGIKNSLKYSLSVILVLTLLETFIPIKLYKVPEPPLVYTFMNSHISHYARFAVYPYGKTEEALFWLPVHKQFLVNPRGYNIPGFSSEKFTKSIYTEAGIAALTSSDIKYLVVFKEGTEKPLDFFITNSKLQIEKEFSDSYLFKVL